MLVLVRACVLGALLPATDDAERDLAVFEKLMAIDDDALVRRTTLSASEVAKLALATGELSPGQLPEFFSVRGAGRAPGLFGDEDTERYVEAVRARKLGWRPEIAPAEVDRLKRAVLSAMGYAAKIDKAVRPEEMSSPVPEDDWDGINSHLGTSAKSLPELVEQLGVMRFGRRPVLADTFCGAGSIPFEAARIGCDVQASDLNPLACMLTWGAFGMIGAPRSGQDVRDEAMPIPN